MRVGELWRRLRFFFCRERFSAELEEEMRLHIELRAESLGEDARKQFGNTTLLKEVSGDMWGTRWLEDFFKDVRFAVRQLRRAPGFTAVAVISLALGIGANTAIFTLIDAVLLKSLPVRDPGGLVLLGPARSAGVVARQSGSFSLYSYDLYKHLRDTNVLDALCAFGSEGANVSVRRAGSSAAQPAGIKLVSGNYFQVLGVSASLGRTIAPSDDSPSAPLVAVVSYRYWKDKLNGNGSAIGSTVDLNGVPVAIAGVASPGFYGETIQPDPPDFWLPISANSQLYPERSATDNPDAHWLYLMGRLRPNLSAAQAQAHLTATLQNWLLTREGSTISAERRRDISKSYIELTPGGGGIPRMQRNYSQTLRLLLGISAAVLLIACANIANLLLARGAARRAETSMRLALGATPGRLVRQSLTESLTLALAGGVLGLMAASAGTKVLLALAFRGTDYIPIRAAPDARVLAFTFALSCGAAIVFGLLPAIRTRSGIASTIRKFHRRFRLGKALIVGEVALSLVVLAGAGAFARSLANLTGQQFGFEREHVLVVNVDPGLAGYRYSQLGPLYRQMYSRLNSLPGVKSASFSFSSPFNECCWAFSIAVEGYTPKPKENMVALLNRVSPHYFETLGTRVLLGRTFDEHDTPASRHVAVVTEAFVQRYWPNENPIGRRFGIGEGNDLEIVGVVANAKYNSPREEPLPMAFLPLLQVKPGKAASINYAYQSNFINTIEIRAIGNPTAIAGEVRQALAEIDRGLPVLRVDTLSGHVDRMLNQDNVIADLAGFFALLALVLTCVGLYGLMAYMVQRRTSEIGLRMALGAQRGAVIAMIIREALAQGLAGILIGIPAAFAAMRLIANQLYGVSPTDPKNSAAAALVLILCIAIAGYLPARRASRIDPMRALRHE
jgi:macrolide transport system ATP-binding/permease protein